VALAVTRAALRDAIANAVADNVNAYEVADVCIQLLGLAPPKNEYDDPFASKRLYVGARLKGKSIEELTELARKVVAEYGDQELSVLLGRLGAHGVSGELKNLIFAADGPKPRIVLRDAINNVIEVVENAQYCLIYDRPLAESGLTWQDLVGWWSEVSGEDGDERSLGLNLYRRLARSLDNDAEKLVFHTYCKRYSAGSFDVPALVPQVYLHYDPYTRRQLGDRPGPLVRQRMDFLLLLPQRARVVLEIDGRQHYAGGDRTADPARYAAMVSEDRNLRLAGYEVYRFGGQELVDRSAAVPMLEAFFDALLDRHRPA